MSTTRFALTALAAGTAASLTDWLFMGVLWHDKYLAHPEVWRRTPGDAAGENNAVLWACLLSYPTLAAFMFACARLHLRHAAALKLALVVWLAAPLPLLIGDALFIKIHPKVTTAHALGWLAKLLVAAFAAGWFLAA
jgi:hypothetical protein